MTIASAREIIIRKFTNYRNSRKRNDDKNAVDREIIESLNTAASAIMDLKAFSGGKRLFKKECHNEIAAKRDELVEDDPELPLVAAYQKALKTLWDNADHDFWENKAGDIIEDIYE